MTRRLGARPKRIAFADLGKTLAGEAHYHTDVVLIDLRDPDTSPLDTYVHECIHLEHKDWSEARVLRESRRAVREMTQTEAATLLRYIARRGVVWEGYDEE